MKRRGRGKIEEKTGTKGVCKRMAKSDPFLKKSFYNNCSLINHDGGKITSS